MNVAGQFDVGSSQTFLSIKMMFCLGDFFGTQTDEIKKLIDGSLAGIFLNFFISSVSSYLYRVPIYRNRSKVLSNGIWL